MEKAFLSGLMAENTRDSTIKTRNRVLGFLAGQTEKSIKESGKKEGSTGKLASFPAMDFKD